MTAIPRLMRKTSSALGILRVAPARKRLILPSKACGLASNIASMVWLNVSRSSGRTSCAMLHSVSPLATTRLPPGVSSNVGSPKLSAKAGSSSGCLGGAAGGGEAPVADNCERAAGRSIWPLSDKVLLVGAVTGAVVIGGGANVGGSSKTVYSRSRRPRDQVTSTRNVMKGSVIGPVDETRMTLLSVRPDFSTSKRKPVRNIGRSRL